MLRPQHAERGQTLVFWAFSLAAALGLTFFVVNYSGTVRWHIRGQNAADAAALTTIAFAGVLWSITPLLLLSAVAY